MQRFRAWSCAGAGHTVVAPNEEKGKAQQCHDQNADGNSASFAVGACVCCQFFAHDHSGRIVDFEGKSLATADAHGIVSKYARQGLTATGVDANFPLGRGRIVAPS